MQFGPTLPHKMLPYFMKLKDIDKTTNSEDVGLAFRMFGIILGFKASEQLHFFTSLFLLSCYPAIQWISYYKITLFEQNLDKVIIKKFPNFRNCWLKSSSKCFAKFINRNGAYKNDTTV